MDDRNQKQKPGDILRIQFPSGAKYVQEIRDFVYRTCLLNGFSRPVAFDMKLVCGEAVSNIIKHAYGNVAGRPVFLEILIFRGYIELRFRDFGKKSSLAGRSEARDLSDYREKGLGLYIISELSDYHYYDQSPESGTVLVIKKRKG